MAGHFVSPYTNKIVAGLVGVRAEVRAARDRVYVKAKADLAGHRDTGAAKVTKSRGTIDFFANLDDKDAGAIEYGGTKKDGTPIPGLHIMRRAAGRA